MIWTLTVSDNVAAPDTSTATATVTITVANAKPTAPTIGGTPTNVTTGASYTLTASGSTDPDGTDSNVAYSWSVRRATETPADKPVATVSSSGVVAIPRVADGAAIGHAYIVTATATDEDMGTNSSSVKLTANNRPPAANAGADQTVNQSSPDGNVTVTLDGSASSDPDGPSLTYAWARPSGPNGGTYLCPPPTPLPQCTPTLSGSGATRTFTAPTLSTYYLNSSTQSMTLIWNLTVTDAHGYTATDAVTITVRNAAPTAPTIGAEDENGNPTTLPSNVRAYTSHDLTATGSTDPDGDDDNLTYSWSVSGSPGAPTATVSSSGTVTIPRNAGVDDAYTVTATATDEDAGASTCDTSATPLPACALKLTVNEQAPNTPPTASAGGTPSGAPGDTIYLHLSISDPDPEDATLWCNWEKTGGTYTGAIAFTFGSFITDETVEYTKGSCADGVRFVIPADATSSQTITVTLTVKDGAHGVATATHTATVTSPAN